MSPRKNVPRPIPVDLSQYPGFPFQLDPEVNYHLGTAPRLNRHQHAVLQSDPIARRMLSHQLAAWFFLLYFPEFQRYRFSDMHWQLCLKLSNLPLTLHFVLTGFPNLGKTTLVQYVFPLWYVLTSRFKRVLVVTQSPAQQHKTLDIWFKKLTQSQFTQDSPTHARRVGETIYIGGGKENYICAAPLKTSLSPSTVDYDLVILDGLENKPQTQGWIQKNIYTLNRKTAVLFSDRSFEIGKSQHAFDHYKAKAFWSKADWFYVPTIDQATGKSSWPERWPTQGAYDQYCQEFLSF